MARPEKRHTFTVPQLQKGITLPTGYRHIIKVVQYNLYVRLEINPNEIASVDDRFTLFGGKNAESKEYQQVKTTQDDLVKGDDYVDLMYTDLIPNIRYWLEIDLGKQGEEYYAFENLAWSQIEPLVNK